MQELRQYMIEDKPHPGCGMCYEQEKISNGTRSMRLDFVRDLGSEIPPAPILTHVDLALSNVCNNRCRMCNPELSTNWYSDAKKLGDEFFPPIKLSGIINSKPILENYDLTKLRYLKLIGGEPLMEQDKFINLLKRCTLDKLRILLTTNTTIIPNEELHDLLKQCEVVWVNLSVDAYGDLNSFLRKGSKWDNVVKVMNWFSEHFPKKAKIHGIISIYNVNNFYILEDFVKTTFKGNLFVEWQMVDGPNWMQPSNLPKKVKNKILKDLTGKTSSHCLSMIKAEFDKEGDIDLFLDKDKKVNDVRNEDWRNLNTELYSLLKD
jgi:sulfatase maturation enzyme AslB (radical SAM superfamily)